MGEARETYLASSSLLVFYVENTNIREVKLQMSCYNLSVFAVTMHSGLCEQYAKCLSLKAAGFDFKFRTHPHYDNKPIQNLSSFYAK